MKKIKRALISVYDKKNLRNLLKTLKKYNVEILSSGGTHKEIQKLGYKSIEVSNYTKYPEILDGRVKTLNPKIHAGILMKRRKKSHKEESIKNNFKEIDLVVVNFYPFEKTLEKSTNHEKIIENIDIGGPAMVRAAAKNYKDVTIVTNISQYDSLIDHLNKFSCSTTLSLREKLSSEAFASTGSYDATISNYFNTILKNNFPKKKLFTFNLLENLRYGENPHQESSIYINKNLKLKQLNGKKLSYNNYNDIFAALNISKSLPKNQGTVIIKHANPCGVAVNSNKIESFKLALKSDPISAYGGIVSCNFKINKKLANELDKIFFEVIIADAFDKDSLKILKKKKNLRIIDSSDLKNNEILSYNNNFNTLLLQTADNLKFSSKNFKVVSKLKPNSKILKNLIFAFNICRFVKSNAIVLTKDKSTVGIGSGQPSRLDSCKIAISKLKKFNSKIEGDILAASDAFFPFVDGIETLVQSGVTAVIQPSGSIRDKEIIKYANDVGIILVFSKTRHFKH